ncbi:vWA domain-containing protein [Roseibacillus persicicus]|uniref:VWFA domain-containing protein n=1 Tax=Roseibacillus persicicus TaxID=454148 RepID=A0A918TCV9_9BACT|nr:VWA domain-containing protein [Roseibacillus persicicus]MDQ8192512.1 VWA domain-containing protein [Roseibacillus persicicus]GHC42591.1 hypothetical protein GCM10007100_04540 [Roseibacillus persicicus]
MNSGKFVSPEVEIALKRQKARATLSSLFVSLLAIVLVGLILFYISIAGINLVQPDIVTYQGSSQKEDNLEKKELNPAIQRKPSSPSSSMAKVIAANTVSPTAIPVPEVIDPVESVDFGDGDDFGSGWGSGGGGNGGGGASFFGQKSNAERIAFVIDYSGSMAAQNRVGIMKKELSKSLDGLTPGTQFQMIFFAGPVWVAGSEVMVKGQAAHEGNTIKGPDGKTYEWVTSGGAHGFKPRGKVQQASWLQVPSVEGKLGSQKREAISAGKDVLKDSQKVVQETGLVWGTRWKYALEMALDMEPNPQVIYFMTDGSTGSEAMQVARTVGARAKSRGITINCVAMMEPKAHDAMKEMAKRTGGKFTVVEADGKSTEIPLK